VTPEQVAEIRAWAKRLRDEGSVAEARAAARAILLLADEVERLRAQGPPREPDEPREPPESPAPRRPSGWRLRERLAAAAPAIPAARAPLPPEQDQADPTPPDATPPDPIHEARLERLREQRKRRRRAQGRIGLAVLAAAALLFGAVSAAARIARPDLEPHGPRGNAQIGAAGLAELVFWVRASRSTLEDMRWILDDKDVTDATVLAGDRLVYEGVNLADGEHRLTVSAPGPFPGADAGHTWSFTVDTVGPALALPRTGVPKGSPVRLSGRVEPGAAVTANGKTLETEGGRFTLAYAEIPRKPVHLVATDRFGNRTTRRYPIALVPRRPPALVRSVHVTAAAWSSPPHRKTVLDLIAQGKINSVELDLKDEAGIVGFNAAVPLGRRIGAIQNIYDLEEAVEMLHARGVYVIGRLVAFRDPIHASAAWTAGRRDEVVQTPSGGPYAGYGGFTNFAHPAVQQYNIDIARAAAEAGVDDILYDYVRRPDGPVESMVFPGLKGTAEAAIADFLAKTARQLRPHRTFLGASVFGVAATRPHEVAQDIPSMARELDYVAPMLYPSHWGPGEYGVADPNGSPYEIVVRSLKDFQTQVRGTGARVVPWLQDFSLGVDYGPAEVRAQIQGARDAGISEWLLWDPLVTYTADALDRVPQKAPPRQRAGSLAANELGEIPVIMYHQIRADAAGQYDLTPAEFRAELVQLHRQGYRPVRAVDLVTGRLDLPAGKTPVVLTFDDSTKEQLAYTADGQVDPETAIGILLDFASEHPDFKPAGTFYVNREPFAGVAEGPEMLRFLVKNGFEIGNHTHDHIPFNEKDATATQQALVLGKRIITRAVPGAQVRTLALPLGMESEPASLARAGSWGGESYRHDGVFLVGAGPAPSPFSRGWKPAAIPRIRTSPWHGGEPDYGSGFWLDLFRRQPDRRYVSDGDPARISFPAAHASKLAPRYEARANPR